MPDHQDFGYDRVRAHASKRANAKIDSIAERSIRRAAENPDTVPRRLHELEKEWDLDRAIMIAFAAMGTAAFALSFRRGSRWRFPLVAQVSFLLAHSIVGWSPQATVLRRLGFRTRQEIDAERHELQELLTSTRTA